MSPLACAWFALCDRPADGYAYVGGNRLAPCCRRCADRVDVKLYTIDGVEL